MSTNPYKQRPKLPVRDPSENIQAHGVHGQRESTPAPSATSRRVVMVPIERIRAGRYQKRETIDQAQYAQLKEQIRDLGFQFVAVLCVDPDDAAYYNLMMGGNIRIQAARELGITEVSAIIREYDREALAKGTYFENNGRQPFTLIDEGLVFKQCQEDMGWTQEEVAEKLLVPGGRSHVALCLLTVTESPDIQEMLRRDPKRGQRCFYYLRQLNVLGEETAIMIRKPIIEDFLLKKISTDEVAILVKQKLQEYQGTSDEPAPSVESARRHSQMTSTVKSFQRFEKHIGEAIPSEAERAALLSLKEKIDELLGRS